MARVFEAGISGDERGCFLEISGVYDRCPRQKSPWLSEPVFLFKIYATRSSAWHQQRKLSVQASNSRCWPLIAFRVSSRKRTAQIYIIVKRITDGHELI